MELDPVKRRYIGYINKISNKLIYEFMNYKYSKDILNIKLINVHDDDLINIEQILIKLNKDIIDFIKSLEEHIDRKVRFNIYNKETQLFIQIHLN